MRNFGKLLVAVFALGTISMTAGCKSDCEKAYDNMVSLAEKEAEKQEDKEAAKKGLEQVKSEETKKKMLEECAKQSPESIECAVKAESFEALAKCEKKAKE